MAQWEEGWPLGLRPVNARVGLVRRGRDLSGSVSFSTLVTGSPTSFTDSSSDLDTESTWSFFHDKSITLGSLIGVSSILDFSRRSTRGRRMAETSRDQRNHYKSKPWLFSLCSRLTTDAVNTTNTSPPSLAHFLEAERRARRRNQGPTIYAPNDFSPARTHANSNPLFAGGRIVPQSSASVGGENGYGVPLLFSCLRGQLAE